MESGIYIVTLNNEEPISVNANDPRIAHKAIKVTRTNCKFGKARNLKAREKYYFKTFGEHNVNFMQFGRNGNPKGDGGDVRPLVHTAQPTAARRRQL